MSLGQTTPWEDKVLIVFGQHLARYHQIARTSQEAAQHGESPVFAEFVQPLIDASQEATPTELGAMWAAVPTAVVVTVRDFAKGTLDTGRSSQA